MDKLLCLPVSWKKKNNQRKKRQCCLDCVQPVAGFLLVLTQLGCAMNPVYVVARLIFKWPSRVGSTELGWSVNPLYVVARLVVKWPSRVGSTEQ